MKPALVFIHGYWSTPATFARLKTRFEAAGHDVHVPALPYHDRDPSLRPPPELGALTIEDYAQFLVALIARLESPPIIIGHSMGGLLAQIVAARVPYLGLILLSTAATASTMAPSLETVRTMGGVMLNWGWWSAPTRIAEKPAMWGIYNGVPDDVARAEYAAHVWDSGRVLAEMTLPSLSKTGATRVDYRRLDKPALVVVGTEDRTTVPEISRSTARKLAGTVDYQEIAGAGHWLFWGATELTVGTLIADWLRQFENPA